MNLQYVLSYLARGALSAFDAIIVELSLDDLKSLRYISHEVSDLLVPYVFDNVDQIYVSAYGPDLDVAQAVLVNPLLRCRVRKLTWDYSTIDPQLLRYSWYDDWSTKLVGQDWTGLCDFIHDHARILENGLDVKVLEHALQCLPQLNSFHVANANLYTTLDPTNIFFSRVRTITSATAAMFRSSEYTIRLLEAAISPSPRLNSGREEERTFHGHRHESDCFQSLVYQGDSDGERNAYWAVKASREKVFDLLTTMSNASELRLTEFVMDSGFWSEYDQIEAWASALEECSPQTMASWVSRFRWTRKLQFCLNGRKYAETSRADRNCLHKFFRLVLQAATDLEDLNLGGVGWDAIDMLQESSYTYSNLRRLTVNDARFQLQSLTEFCRKHFATLEVLEIRNSHLTGNSWRQFLTNLIDLMVSPTLQDATRLLTGNEKLYVYIQMVSEDEDTQVPRSATDTETRPTSRPADAATHDMPDRMENICVRMLLPKSPSLLANICDHTSLRGEWYISPQSNNRLLARVGHRDCSPCF